MRPPLLRVERVSKKFCRQSDRTASYALRDIAGAMLGRRVSCVLRPGEFWSLDEVSLELAQVVAPGTGARSFER